MCVFDWGGCDFAVVGCGDVERCLLCLWSRKSLWRRRFAVTGRQSLFYLTTHHVLTASHTTPKAKTHREADDRGVGHRERPRAGAQPDGRLEQLQNAAGWASGAGVGVTAAAAPAAAARGGARCYRGGCVCSMDDRGAVGVCVCV